MVAGGMWRGWCGGLVAGATNDGISHLKQDSSESEKLARQLKSNHHKAAFKTKFDHLGACTAFMLLQTGIPLIQLGVATCTQLPGPLTRHGHGPSATPPSHSMLWRGSQDLFFTPQLSYRRS